jgi:hypothetical protein
MRPEEKLVGVAISYKREEKTTKKLLKVAAAKVKYFIESAEKSYNKKSQGLLLTEAFIFITDTGLANKYKARINILARDLHIFEVVKEFRKLPAVKYGKVLATHFYTLRGAERNYMLTCIKFFLERNPHLEKMFDRFLTPKDRASL